MSENTNRTPATEQAFDALFRGLRSSDEMRRELSLAVLGISWNRRNGRIRARQRQHRYYSEIMSNERPNY